MGGLTSWRGVHGEYAGVGENAEFVCVFFQLPRRNAEARARAARKTRTWKISEVGLFMFSISVTVLFAHVFKKMAVTKLRHAD